MNFNEFYYTIVQAALIIIFKKMSGLHKSAIH